MTLLFIRKLYNNIKIINHNILNIDFSYIVTLDFYASKFVKARGEIKAKIFK